MALDKFRLIEEVRKRHILWDCQRLAYERNRKQYDAQWAEIGKILKVNAFTCRRIWHQLRVNFCQEANLIPTRIAKAKKEGKYDPNKKYSSWTYYDALRFVANGRSPRAKLDLSFVNNVEMMKKNETEQRHPPERCLENNSFQTESDKEIELQECKNSNQLQYEGNAYFEIHHVSDNEMEIVDNKSLFQPQIRKENLIPNESANTSQLIPVDDSDKRDQLFKSLTVSLSNIKQENECVATTSLSLSNIKQENECVVAASNEGNVLKNDIVVKEEPELQTENEMYFTKKEDIKQILEKKSSRAAKPAPSHCSERYNAIETSNEQHNQPTFPEEDATSTPTTSDEDYCFLYSFLSQTKHMTQLQKMEFRVNMKSLLLNNFPGLASTKILEKQLLLPEDNDPDKKFLITFLPFIKSMSLVENIQFRSMMTDIVLKVLSNNITYT